MSLQDDIAALLRLRQSFQFRCWQCDSFPDFMMYVSWITCLQNDIEGLPHVDHVTSMALRPALPVWGIEQLLHCPQYQHKHPICHKSHLLSCLHIVSCSIHNCMLKEAMMRDSLVAKEKAKPNIVHTCICGHSEEKVLDSIDNMVTRWRGMASCNQDANWCLF